LPKEKPEKPTQNLGGKRTTNNLGKVKLKGRRRNAKVPGARFVDGRKHPAEAGAVQRLIGHTNTSKQNSPTTPSGCSTAPVAGATTQTVRLHTRVREAER